MADELENLDLFNLGVDDVKTEEKKNNQNNLADLYRPKAKDGSDGTYKAKIRFVPNPKDPSKSLIHKFVYWLEDPSGKGRLIDSPKSVGEYCPIADTWGRLKDSDNAVDNRAAQKLQRRRKYYALIKVIDDPQRPDLNGSYMIYQFGAKIKEKIDEQINPDFDEPTQVFDLFEGKDFHLKITQQGEYNNYDKSQFAPNKSAILIGSDLSRQAQRSNEDKKLLQQELEQAPDLSEYEFKPWDDNTTQFVYKCLGQYINIKQDAQEISTLAGGQGQTGPEDMPAKTTADQAPSASAEATTSFLENDEGESDSNETSDNEAKSNQSKNEDGSDVDQFLDEIL